MISCYQLLFFKYKFSQVVELHVRVSVYCLIYSDLKADLHLLLRSIATQTKRNCFFELEEKKTKKVK